MNYVQQIDRKVPGISSYKNIIIKWKGGVLEKCITFVQSPFVKSQ